MNENKNEWKRKWMKTRRNYWKNKNLNKEKKTNDDNEWKDSETREEKKVNIK